MRFVTDYENDVKRAKYDLSSDKSTSMHAGFYYPIYMKRMFPGDKFVSPIHTLLQSQPMVSPLMGMYELRTEFYFEPLANLYGWIDNNTKRSTQEIIDEKKHSFRPYLAYNKTKGDYWNEAFTVMRSSLLDYCGVAPGYKGVTPVTDSPFLCLDKILAYLDIYRSYIVYTQESSVPYCIGLSGNGDYSDSFQGFVDVKTLDKLFLELRCLEEPLHPDYLLNDSSSGGYDQHEFEEKFANKPGLSWFLCDYLPKVGRSHGGLGFVTYKPDMYRSLLADTVATVKSKVDVKNNQFDIDVLRFKNKWQLTIDRYDVSGGRYSKILRTVWGTKTRRNLDIPDIIGVSTSIIDPSTVTSVASTDGASLGDFGGNIDKMNHSNTHVFEASEDGFFIACVSITPRVRYCQNIERDMLETNFADDYNPLMANLGFEDVPLSDYSVLPTLVGGVPLANNKNPFTTVVGKQSAWLRLTTDVGRVHGEFATGGYLRGWSLNRQYTVCDQESFDSSVGAVTQTVVTQYVNPTEWQYPFVNTALDHPNLMLNVYFDIDAIRPIGKHQMPTLGQ